MLWRSSSLLCMYLLNTFIQKNAYKYYLRIIITLKPGGYSCDVKDGRCNKKDHSLPLFVKTKSFKAENVKSIICADGLSECRK